MIKGKHEYDGTRKSGRGGDGTDEAGLGDRGKGADASAVLESGCTGFMASEDREQSDRKLTREPLKTTISHRKHPPQVRHSKGDRDGKSARTAMAKKNSPSNPTLSKALLADYQYDMSHCRRGRGILINIANFEEDTDLPKRPRTEVDIKGLGGALEDLGFLVQVFEDLRCQQIKRLMRLLSQEDHSDADCLLVAVMTHGNDGEIYGMDGPMPTREITAPFRGDACRSLVGKPKLFIFQACRGIMVDHGVAKDRRDVDEPDALIGYKNARTIPIEADFLVAYSSPEGYASWRNATSGAWFIQSLVKAMATYGSCWEFTRILTLVNRMVALQYESLSGNQFMTCKKQMPCFVSTLTKELYFKPKDAHSEASRVGEQLNDVHLGHEHV